MVVQTTAFGPVPLVAAVQPFRESARDSHPAAGPRGARANVKVGSGAVHHPPQDGGADHQSKDHHSKQRHHELASEAVTRALLDNQVVAVQITPKGSVNWWREQIVQDVAKLSADQIGRVRGHLITLLETHGGENPLTRMTVIFMGQDPQAAMISVKTNLDDFCKAITAVRTGQQNTSAFAKPENPKDNQVVVKLLHDALTKLELDADHLLATYPTDNLLSYIENTLQIEINRPPLADYRYVAYERDTSPMLGTVAEI